jgi:hypothetical protein
MCKVGISDGRMTEVSGEGLAEGMAVITDQRSRGRAMSEAAAATGQRARVPADAPPLIRLRGITKVYGEGALAFQALKGVDLDIARAISWPSWAPAARANPPP